MSTYYDHIGQMLNGACAIAQVIENVARLRPWRWVRNSIEAAVTSYRLINPMGILAPFLQPVFEFIGENEGALGLVLALLAIGIMLGEHRSLSSLLERFKVRAGL